MWTSSKITDTEQFFILLSVLCYLCRGLWVGHFTSLVSVYGCFACICICVPYAYLLTYQPEEGVGYLGAEIVDSCKLSY